MAKYVDANITASSDTASLQREAKQGSQKQVAMSSSKSKQCKRVLAILGVWGFVARFASIVSVTVPLGPKGPITAVIVPMNGVIVIRLVLVPDGIVPI